MSYSLDAEGAAVIKDLCNEYIEDWKQFYPSRAFSRGFLDSIFGFEDYSQECITNWLTFNKKTLTDISQKESILALQDRIDACSSGDRATELNPIHFHVFYCINEHDNEKGGIVGIVLFLNDSAF